MTDWRPSSTAAAARRRAELIARIRAYFRDANVLSVDTPALAATTVTDPNIASIKVGDRYLQTSPEYHMKRLLAAGYPDIYAVCHVFRDGETGSRHLPEFTMVEWYRLGFELAEIVADTLTLIGHVLERPDLAAAATRLSYRDAFLAATGIDPFDADVAALARTCDADDGLRASIGDDRDAWLDLAWSTRVAGSFAMDQLTVVQHYPASQAALARLCPTDERVADRFEVCFGSLELANGYVELTDAAELAKRFERDRETRLARGAAEIAADQRLLAALDAGLPPCAGVALGFERLHMVDAATDDIRNVVSFAE